eukprot:TRINITY_DN12341_c0_g1_i1.p1 TRINITY_DN12341_c0_g1~~TRINITY_DN12341_c0_g1_i1.p1  ORF type:complete len:193 (-),score=26.74 TRINITY_DN12341_c0_g1_i1:17-595(-)
MRRAARLARCTSWFRAVPRLRAHSQAYGMKRNSKLVISTRFYCEQSEEKVDYDTISALAGFNKEDLQTRKVCIYQPGRMTATSQLNEVGTWKIMFTEPDDDANWNNRLMGWASTRNPLTGAQVVMSFVNLEKAKQYCKKNGWEYVIDADHPINEAASVSYDANFAHIPIEENPFDLKWDWEAEEKKSKAKQT